jgi:hypothetical protein
LYPQFEAPTVLHSELGQIIYIWPTVQGRNVKLGIRDDKVKISVEVDALRFVLPFPIFISIPICFSFNEVVKIQYQKH